VRFLRTNTAVLITVGPFVDKTDGVTLETALTITNERITLTADTDAGSAPTNILDNVTGATSGTANDLNYITGNDAGLMQLELAAADVNRLGRMFLTITDAANHVPVFHEFMVLPAAIYDWLILGTIVPLPANVTTWLGTAAATPTVAGVPEVDLTHVAGATTNVAALATNVDAILTDTGTTLDARIPAALVSGRMDSSVGAMAANVMTAAAAAADLTTELQSGLATAAALDTVDNFLDTEIAAIVTTLGTPAGASVSADLAAVKAQTAAIEVDTAEIGAAGAGLTNIDLPNQTMNITGNLTGNVSGTVGSVTGAVGSVTGLTAANLDATISSRATPAQVNTEADTALADAALATAANLATVAGYLDTEIAAIKAKTDSLTFTGATRVDANVAAVNNSTTGMDKLSAHLPAVLKVVIGIGSTTTSLVLNATTGIDGAAPSAVNDFFNGRVIVFTSGALAGQATSISDYVGSTVTLTVVALTSAPSAADTAVIV
jgi:hypothetical protein